MEKQQEIQEILKEAESYGLKEIVIKEVESKKRFIRQIDKTMMVQLYESAFQSALNKAKV